MAGISSSTARSIRLSGCEAPWRKLKALAAWSSMYWLVIERHHPPLILHPVTHQAAAQNISVLCARGQIPLFAAPERGGPPLSAGEPRTIGMLHRVAALSEGECNRALALQGDECRLSRTQHPHCRAKRVLHNFWRLSSRNAERLQGESIHLMGVSQNRTTHIAIAHERANTRQCDI